MLRKLSDSIDKLLRFFTFRQRFLLFATTFLMCVPFPLYWVITGQKLYIQSARDQIENFQNQQKWNLLLYHFFRSEIGITDQTEEVLPILQSVPIDPQTKENLIQNLNTLLLTESNSVRYEQRSRFLDYIFKEIEGRLVETNLLPYNPFLNHLLNRLYRIQMYTFLSYITQNTLKKESEDKNYGEGSFHTNLSILLKAIDELKTEISTNIQFSFLIHEPFLVKAIRDKDYIINYLDHLSKQAMFLKNQHEEWSENTIKDLLDENSELIKKLLDFGVTYNQRSKEKHQLITFLCFAMVISTGTIILFYIFFRVLTSHFLALEEHIKAMAKGKFKKCFCSNAGDEFGPVGKALDEMSQTIQQVTSELQRMGRQLTESIHQTTRLMTDQNLALLNNEIKTKEMDAHTIMLSNRIKAFADPMNALSLNLEQNALPTTVQNTLQKMEFTTFSLSSRSSYILEHLKNLKNKLEDNKNLFIFLDSVSNQAALLSLNSAIEASNVDFHKQGFIKITDEIQRFADKTASSSDNMQKMVKGITTSIDHIYKDTDTFFLALSESHEKLKIVEKYLTDMEIQIQDQTEKFQRVNKIMQDQAKIADEIKKSLEHLVLLASDNGHQTYYLGQIMQELRDTAEKLQRVLNLFYRKKKD